MMKKTQSLAATAFGAVALCIAATTVHAAPVTGAGTIAIHAGNSGEIEKVTWGRHCYWHHGYRYCGWRRHYWRPYHYHRWSWRHRWHHHRYW